MPNIVEVVVHATNETKAAFAEAEAGSASMSSKLATAGLVGAAGLIAVGVASVKMAGDYQNSTARLVTSAGETNKNIDQVRQGMLNMASQVGTSAMELSKGMYVVESAGYHGAAGLTVLKAAAQGAKDENASLATVSNAVTDVLVDYHMKAGAAADVTSKLVTAVSFGKTNFEEFSQSMSVVLPLASAMHLKLADVAGVEAEMTSHGISAQEASQQMANAMRHLMDPTGAMVKSFKEFGISADDVNTHLQSQGLGGTLQWLRGVAEQMAPSLGMTVPQALAKLMGSANGLQVALATTGENAKGTQAAIAGISSASADAQGNVKGFSEIQGTLNQKMAQVQAAGESLAIELGNKLLPAVTTVFSWMANHVQTVTDVAIAIGILVAGLAAYAIVAKTVAIAQGVLNAVMDMNPFVAIGIAVVAIAALVIKYHTQIWNFIQDTWHNVSKFVSQVWGDIYGFASHWWPLILGPSGLIIIYHNQVWSFIQRIWHDVTNFLSSAWSDIYNFARHWWPLILGPSGLIIVYHQQIQTFVQNIWRNLTGWLSSAWGTIYSDARSVWGNILGFFRGIPASVLSALSSLGGQLRSWGSSIMNSMLSGIKGIWSDVVNFFKNLPGDILHALGIHSPPQWAIDAGQWIMKGLGIGMSNAHESAAQAATALKNKVVGGTQGIPASGSPTVAQQTAMKMAALVGWTGAQWTALNNVAMAESGWSMTAQNPSSGAYGIAQFINGPSEYAQYGGNANTLAGQLTGFFNYIAQRYGNPVNAWAHEQADHWYAAGGATSPGWAMVGEHGRELVKLPGGANVYPAGATAQMMGQLSSGGVHLTLELGDSFRKAGLTQQQLEDIRYTVRTKGGKGPDAVQKAFGSL
jgi:TP901 family phage tail tape measure protein